MQDFRLGYRAQESAGAELGATQLGKRH